MQYFSTCQVRASRFYQRCTRPPASTFTSASSTVSSRSRWTLPDHNCRAEWVLPDLNCGLQISVTSVRSAHVKKKDVRINARLNDGKVKPKRCQIECQKDCQHKCQKVCQNRCQIDCQKECQSTRHK